jgi:hypothetical protein
VKSNNIARKHKPMGENNPIKKKILNLVSISLRYILKFLSIVVSFIEAKFSEPKEERLVKLFKKMLNS